jgi:cytoskeletal protein CcmA (bactofilin family)
MKHTSGFTLVIVLILTSIASIVVLSSLKDTVFQERLSGNFQKKLNARLMSDKGVFASMEQLQQAVEDDPMISLNDLVAANTGASGSGELKGSQFNGTTKLDADGNIVVSSLGKRFEGENTLQAVFEFVQGKAGKGSASQFPSGVVSCSDISYGGHSAIDSYNSELGDYNEHLDNGTLNSGKQAIVTLIGSEGKIKLGGAKSAINGDVLSQGDLILDGRNISGNVMSNASLTIKGKTHIGGNASAYVDYTQKSGTVAGNVTANGAVDISGGSVGGDVNSGPGTVEKVAITNNSSEQGLVCDSINLRQEVQNISSSSALADLDVDYSLILETKKAVNNSAIKAQAATFMGVATDIYYFEDVKVKKGEIKVADNHNVVMFVNGDFTLDAKGLITIPADSSLTLIVKGKVDIKANSAVDTPTHGVTAEGRPVFSIYSAYEGGTGVKLSGGHKQVYAVVYAPYTKVSIKSNAGFKGSVLGGSLESKGGGAIHYDTALSKASFGGTVDSSPTTVGRLVFKKWIFAPYTTTGDEEDDEYGEGDEYNDEADDS